MDISLIDNISINGKDNVLLGAVFPFLGIKRIAFETYVKSIDQSNLSPEEKLSRILNAKKIINEFDNQREIASIAVKTAAAGTDFSTNTLVDEEWLNRFMDSAKYVSRKDIQLVWGRILAKEFERPGTTPPGLIRVLSEITSKDAHAFSVLCNMRMWECFVSENLREVTNVTPIICVPYLRIREMCSDLGLTFEEIEELESIGLLHFDTVFGYELNKSDNLKSYKCLGRNYYINCDEHLPGGCIMLTSIGKALCEQLTFTPIDGYEDILKEYFTSEGILVSENNLFSVENVGENVCIEFMNKR